MARKCDKSPDLMLAKQWISHCNHDDHICTERYTSTQSDQSGNPTRLLQIDNDAHRVRLIQTIQGERYEYVTLSHRWGHKKTASTRKENVHSHVHRGIQTLDLPATFRDAVIVVHTIGYQYLWIDSLCIVQDDTEDWELECPRMASIYQGSVLTIAGTAAIDSHSGLLREREFLGNPSYQTKLRYRDELGNAQEHLTLYYPGRPSTHGGLHDAFPEIPEDHARSSVLQSLGWTLRDTLSEFPEVPDHNSVLQGRGWIFQEGLLSRRMLNFAPGQMYMVCHQGARYETSLYQGVFPHPDSTVNPTYPPVHATRWETDFGYYRWWRGTVAKYSSCQFTTIMDRLPALSGIANRFKPPEPDQYLAGIWRHDILRSLLWRRRGKPHSDAPAEYLGPSWSWVSVPAKIEFIYVEDGSTSVSCASLVSAVTVPKGVDAYGRVASAMILIRGKVSKIAFEEAVQKDEQFLKPRPVISRPGWYEPPEFYVDDPGWTPPVSESAEVDDAPDDETYPEPPRFLLLLISIVRFIGGRAYLLALERVSGKELIYRRLGVVVRNQTRVDIDEFVESFKDWEETEIAII